MKKFLLSCFVTVAMFFSIFFTGCTVTQYSINDDAFVGVVAYNADVSFDGLKIVQKNGETEKEIPITSDMIVSCDKTDTVGPKKLTVKYDENTFVVDFFVKYRVDFTIQDEVYESQYVLQTSEIVLPQPPVLSEYDFVAWTPQIPQTISDNIVFDAQLTVTATGIPVLQTYRATYGDKLESIQLPHNTNGSWAFVDTLDTTVGNAGENLFEAKFTPTDTNLAPITQKVKIKVDKKEVEILNVVESFDYDGEEKVPVFDLEVEGLETEVVPYYQGEAINVGTYEFEIEISETNYKGSYYGSFEIKAVSVTIAIEDVTIDFTEDCPDVFEYDVTDKNGQPLSENLKTLMGIEIVKPTYQHTGEYEILANISNTNFNVTVNTGYLFVQKVEHELGDSELPIVGGANIVYGNVLETLLFENIDVRGEWSWKTPDKQVVSMESFVATAVFTPKEDRDYLPSEKEVEISVLKRTLSIVIDNNEFTYDANEHSVEYSVEGIIEQDKDTVDITGQISKTVVGKYALTLSVDSADERYVGSTQTALIINQASISDFTTVYTPEWSTVLVLNDVKLNDGYAWVKPFTHITELGSQSYPVVFTPEDTVNYKTEQGMIMLDVKKATASISALSSYEFTYNKGNSYPFYSVSTSHTESSLTYAYIYNDESVAKLSDTGIYEVTFILPESEHYKEAQKTITVQINQVENKDAVAEHFDAVYGETLADFERYLPTNTTGTWSWQTGNTTVVGDAGQRTHVALFKPEDETNYKSRTVNIQFNIAKKVVQKPIITAKQYTGDTLTSGLETTPEYIVTEVGGIDVGSYDVVLKLIDANNYRWSEDETTDEIVEKFVITQNESNNWIEGEEPYIESFIYGRGTAARYKGTALMGITSVVFTEKGTNNVVPGVPTNVGDYYVTFAVAETENYNGLEAVLEFSIRHIPVDVPVIADLTYIGEDISPNISSEYYSVDCEEHTNVGEYSLTLTLVDPNHKWTDGKDGLVRTVSYNISKALNNDWVNQPTINNWVYTPTGGTNGTATSIYGTPVVEYKAMTAGDETYTTTLPKNAGTYVARFTVADTQNYNGISKTIEFIVSKATPKLTAPTYNMSTIYYENNVDVTTCYVTAPSVEVAAEAGTNIVITKPVLKTSTITSGQKYERVGFDINFISASNNYESVTTTAYINLYKVAYIDSVYYGSIENALKNATSGQTVMVIPDTSGNVKIVSNNDEKVVIGEGVTLALPYVSASGAHTVNSSGTATLIGVYTRDQENPNFAAGIYFLTLTSKVVVEAGVEIENYGNIMIAGETSGGGPNRQPTDIYPGIEITGMAGQTARYYAKFLLKADSKIICKNKGKIDCYGFIDEETKNNGSQVIMENGSNLSIPFVLNDFSGGNYMKTTGQDSRKISSFNQFEIRNVVASLRLEYGCSVVGHVNCYASTAKFNNYTSVKIAGADDSYLLELKENSYIICKYDIDETSRPSGTDKWKFGVNIFNFYGGAEINSLKIKVSVALSQVTLDTSKSTFPISWRQNFIFNSGSYKMNNKCKLLPGAIMRVESGATLDIDQLTVYEEFNDTKGTETAGILEEMQYGYGKSKLPPARLVVNGTLIAGALGGKVQTEVENAVVQVTTQSCLSYEVVTGSFIEKKVFGVTVSRYYEIHTCYSTGETLKLVYNANNDPVTVESSNVKYVSSNGTWVLQNE